MMSVEAPSLRSLWDSMWKTNWPCLGSQAGLLEERVPKQPKGEFVLFCFVFGERCVQGYREASEKSEFQEFQTNPYGKSKVWGEIQGSVAKNEMEGG